MQTEQITTANGMLTAARAGSGRDIVILHSLLTDRTAFDPVLPALAQSHRVTLVNLPGFHGSEPVMALLDAYIARIEDGFEEFGIKRDSIVMGNGFGGTVALAFALAHPDRMSKLVLCDAAPGFPEAGKQAFTVMAEKVAAGGLGAIADIAANRVFHAAYLAQNPKAIEERRAVLMQIDPVAFRNACTVLVEADLVPQLHKCKLPTLVVCGELDQATPPALNKLIAEKVPNGKYVELPDCGHCPPLEAPQAFLQAIKDFVGLSPTRDA
jgi:pimeloyl-ACP methyl ester carboxylesterase